MRRGFKTTLNGLEIPDPNDREFRIKSVEGLTDPEIQISFSYGRDEYGQGEKFVPNQEQAKKTCEEIFDETKKFGIKGVILDGWRGSAFMIRQLENENRTVVVPEKFKDGIKVKGNIAVRIVFSPSVLDSLKVDLKNDKEIFKNILELFEGDGSVEVQFPLEAETEIGVEVDFCDVEDENNFSDEEMDYIMYRIEDCLEFGSTASTTVWVRQGSPELLYKVDDRTT